MVWMSDMVPWGVRGSCTAVTPFVHFPSASCHILTFIWVWLGEQGSWTFVIKRCKNSDISRYGKVLTGGGQKVQTQNDRENYLKNRFCYGPRGYDYRKTPWGHGEVRGHDYRKTPWGHREVRGNLGQVLSSQPQKQLMDTLIDTLLPELWRFRTVVLAN